MSNLLFNNPDQQSRATRGFNGPSVAVLAGLVLTGAAFWQAREIQVATFQAQFERDAATRTQLIVRRLDENVHALKSVQGLFHGSQTVSRGAFRIFTSPLVGEASELEAMAWAPRVLRPERTQFEAQANKDGLQQFQVTELAPGDRFVPAGPRAEYYPILYLEPRARNRKLFGFDLGSNPIRWQAMEQARDTGEPTIGERVHSLQESRQGYAFFLALPVYAKDKTLNDQEERRSALEGFVVANFGANEFFRKVLFHTTPMGFTMDLIDLSAPAPRQPIGRWKSRDLGTPTIKTRLVGKYPKRMERFAFAGREWGLEITATDDYLSRNYPAAYWTVLPFGFTLTLLLGVYVSKVTSQREEMTRAVQESTAELRTANQQLQEEIRRRGEVEADLRSHREQLEQLVQARTGELLCANEQLRREIDERTKAEAATQKLADALEQRVAERTVQLEAANKELDSFAYSVSHDLRAPLRAVDGYARILGECHAEELTSEGVAAVAKITKEAQRMNQLIDDLLAFSRKGFHQMQLAEVDMTALTNEVIAELTGLAGQRTLTFKVNPLPPVRGDRAMLRQAWVNLVSNAVKYTRNQTESIIEVGGHSENGTNFYSIKDNGVGFDMKYAHKLFGVFQRLHGENEFEGTGVGLALVQRVVQRHGGKIWAEAKPGLGATFHFTMPRGGA